jgi:uncharacterized repeat protein (TIGR01451 family)
MVSDTSDDDMSGALIFATVKGSGKVGPQVPFAAAWGQNPEFVGLRMQDQQLSLDLGTLVPVLTTINVCKRVELAVDNCVDGNVSPTDVLKYTIKVSNMGQVMLGEAIMTFIDDGMDEHVTYIPGTTVYITENLTDHEIADDLTGTPFPLDGDGIINLAS